MTDLMVFVIQRSQNKDSLAINLKLNRNLMERVLKEKSMTDSVTIEHEAPDETSSI